MSNQTHLEDEEAFQVCSSEDDLERLNTMLVDESREKKMVHVLFYYLSALSVWGLHLGRLSSVVIFF